MKAAEHRRGASLLLGLGLMSGAAWAGNCNDPWVTQAVIEVLRRPPASASAPECNIRLYNNGHWNSYAQLRLAVGTYWGTHAYPTSQAPAYSARPGVNPGFAGQPRVIQNPGRLVGPDGGSLIGNDAGSYKR
jgi:hypothetical protein